MWCRGRALADDLEADLTRVLKLHQFVQVVSAACRTLAALAGLISKVCGKASRSMGNAQTGAPQREPRTTRGTGKQSVIDRAALL